MGGREGGGNRGRAVASPLSPQGWPQWGGGPAAAPTARLALSPMATDPPPPPPRLGTEPGLDTPPPGAQGRRVGVAHVSRRCSFHIWANRDLPGQGGRAVPVLGCCWASPVPKGWSSASLAPSTLPSPGPGKGGVLPKHLWVHEQAESRGERGRAPLAAPAASACAMPAVTGDGAGAVPGVRGSARGWGPAPRQPHACSSRGEDKHGGGQRSGLCPTVLRPGMTHHTAAFAACSPGAMAGRAGRGQSLRRRQGAGRGGHQQGAPLFDFATHWNGAEGHWERREPRGRSHPCSRLYRTPPVPAVPPLSPSQLHTPAHSPPSP